MQKRFGIGFQRTGMWSEKSFCITARDLIQKAVFQDICYRYIENIRVKPGIANTNTKLNLHLRVWLKKRRFCFRQRAGNSFIAQRAILKVFYKHNISALLVDNGHHGDCTCVKRDGKNVGWGCVSSYEAHPVTTSEIATCTVISAVGLSPKA
nr:MAG TPA: hypothetical protein [Caudoviricetes sp.]